jgi:hypothetical protein
LIRPMFLQTPAATDAHDDLRGEARDKRSFGSAAMWMSSHKHTSPLFSL